MRVQFIQRTHGPERLVCDAALVFDDRGPLYNLKIVGFSLWRNQEGDIYVTLPCRTYGAGPERRSFEFVRSVTGALSDVTELKSWIIAEYRRSEFPSSRDAPPSETLPTTREVPQVK